MATKDSVTVIFDSELVQDALYVLRENVKVYSILAEQEKLQNSTTSEGHLKYATLAKLSNKLFIYMEQLVDMGEPENDEFH